MMRAMRPATWPVRRKCPLRWRIAYSIATLHHAAIDPASASPTMPSRGISRRLSAMLIASEIAAVHTGVRVRSEEHTSELQSLMRISYAVFCLKKKKHDKRQKDNE